MPRFIFVLTIISGLAVLSGCSPMGAAAGAGATLGVASAQDGGIRGAATDTAIRFQIHDSWFKHNVEMYRHLDMTVKEGRVLITGRVPDPDMRVDAVRLAWQANGVRQVINEIRVEKSGGVTGFAKDSWITGSLKTKLTFDKKVQSINYTIDTVNATVYLMGVAQNEAEHQRVIDHARNQRFVEGVVSYVRVRGDGSPPLPEPTGLRQN
ncbi:MAG: BON domain-containing protein [Pseudomonadota bacterium]